MTESIWEYCTRPEQVAAATAWHKVRRSLAEYNHMTGQNIRIKEEL